MFLCCRLEIEILIVFQKPTSMKDIFDLLLLLGILAINIFIFFSFIGMLIGSASGAPFVPTGKKIAQKMIALAKIQSGEKVYDLGCGDGRLVFMAAEKGADAVGVEISLPIVLWARLRKYIGKKQGAIIHGSLWNTDVSDADVIFLYLFPHMVARFEEEIFPRLKKGCRVVTHGFAMRKTKPDSKWKPPHKRRGKILVYIRR